MMFATVVLAVEGSFYRTADRRLLGYAYPTYHGSGPKTDIPPAERPTIARVVEAAIGRQGLAEESVSAGPDLILFRALPLVDAGRSVGATWVMQRLSAVRSPQRQLYRSALFGLLAVSGTTAAAAWFFTRRLDRGVTRLEEGLLANAVEALHERGGRITVEVERPTPAALRIAVADTGPGVPPEAVERLFEPFFTTRKDGTGLGLFLSAEMTRALGGELRYCERPGGGACFEVTLPC
jgi:anti-sigma regulatory factor (Ser/Thr protein kinase)